MIFKVKITESAMASS